MLNSISNFILLRTFFEGFPNERQILIINSIIIITIITIIITINVKTIIPLQDDRGKEKFCVESRWRNMR